MMRFLCIVIALLVAAKEVVAFRGELNRSESKVYSALDFQSLDVWLCECEDTSERNETDDTDTHADLFCYSTSNAIEQLSMATIRLKTWTPYYLGIPQHLFITLRNLRL